MHLAGGIPVGVDPYYDCHNFDIALDFDFGTRDNLCFSRNQETASNKTFNGFLPCIFIRGLCCNSCI